MKRKITKKQKIFLFATLVTMAIAFGLYVYDTKRRQFAQMDIETIKYGRGIGGSYNTK